MPYLAPRNALEEAKDTLSSWDKCMDKNYCKWPVIVVIVIGSLIVLSIVFCIVRCACCGAECACCCFRCCAGCCGSGRSKHKRMKSEPPPPMFPPSANQPPPLYPPGDTRPVNQQYRSHAAPTFNPAPAPEEPQFARFDAPAKPVNEDALPAMPTWSEATSSHVEETVVPEKRGDLEMDRLDHNGSVTGTPVAGAAAVGAARRSPGRSPVQQSPQDSYGFPAGYQNDSFVRNGSRGPSPLNGQYAMQQEGYRGISPVQAQSLSPVYGAGAGYAQNQQYGRRSPNQGYDQPYSQPATTYNEGPPNLDGYGNRAQSPPRDAPDMRFQDFNFDQPPPRPSPSPQYALSGSTRYEPSEAAYPGQQAYQPPESSYPGQQSYQAFRPT